MFVHLSGQGKFTFIWEHDSFEVSIIIPYFTTALMKELDSTSFMSLSQCCGHLQFVKIKPKFFCVKLHTVECDTLVPAARARKYIRGQSIEKSRISFRYAVLIRGFQHSPP